MTFSVLPITGGVDILYLIVSAPKLYIIIVYIVNMNLSISRKVVFLKNFLCTSYSCFVSLKIAEEAECM